MKNIAGEENSSRIEAHCAKAISYIEWKAAGLNRPNGKYLRRQEKRMEGRIKRRFKKQMEWVIEQMAELEFFQNREDQQNTVRFLTRKYFKDIVIEFLQNLPQEEELAQDIVSSANTTYRKGARTIFQSLEMAGAGVVFDLVNEYAVEYIAKKKELHLSNFRGSISNTTKKRILAILVEAAETGDSYQKTARKIRALGSEGVFSRARAELIAVRETGLAYEEGNRKMAEIYQRETSAILQKKWLTVGDDKVTPSHSVNQADGWIGFEETFSGTGDKNAPASDNPRCRCTTIYRRVNLQGEPI